MHKLAFALTLAVCAPVLAAPSAQDKDSPRSRYQLRATLDEVAHRIFGEAEIRFVNSAERSVRELYFHLYPNAFEHADTVFMREGGANIRERPLGTRGSLHLAELTTADGTDLLAGADSELVPSDKTQLRVTLPRAIEPGEVLELRVRFTTQLPEIVARSGYEGSFHALAQWFPKLARLESDGHFASFPYHGLGEFYADFADYELTLDVPQRFVVAAGGVRVSSRNQGARRIDTFRADRVHDIAAVCAPGLERVIARTGDTRIEVYAPRGYGAALLRQSQLIAAGLRWFGAAFGPYAYPQLTVVLPPRIASGAAGMEYPTFFLSAGPWFALPRAAPDPTHDIVAIHELAHQWFSGMIATNEVESPALDEGITEWSTHQFLRSRFALLRRPGLDPFTILEATFLFRGQSVPSSLLPAPQYRYANLARAVYVRPGRVLHELERRHGQPRLMAAVGRYAREQRFRHPGWREFFAAFDRELGPGFSERELRPALEGERDFAPTGEHRPEPKRWLPDVWYAIQALLHVLGP